MLTIGIYDVDNYKHVEVCFDNVTILFNSGCAAADYKKALMFVDRCRYNSAIIGVIDEVLYTSSCGEFVALHSDKYRWEIDPVLGEIIVEV